MGRVAIAICALGTTLYLAPAALATTITVTTQSDTAVNDGQCSLREALTAANTDFSATPGPLANECPAGSGTDTIVLPAGTYTLGATAAGDDFNFTGDLDVRNDVSIVGAGRDSTTISGGGTDRVLDITGPWAASLTDLTISGGRTPDGSNGGNVTGSDGAGAGAGSPGTGVAGGSSEDGGGIRNAGGTLTIANSRLSNNHTGNGGNGGNGHGGAGGTSGGGGGAGTGGDGGDAGAGGGVFSSGTLTITDCLVVGNGSGNGGNAGNGVGGTGGSNAAGAGGPGGSATDGIAGWGGDGGGVGTALSTTTTIARTRISGNSTGNGGAGAAATAGDGGHGGGTADGGSGGPALGGRSPGFGGNGGGVSGPSALTISDSTVENNQTGHGGPSNAAAGGRGGDAGGTGGNGGAGGDASLGSGGDGGKGGGVEAPNLTMRGTAVDHNTTGSGGAGGAATAGAGGNASANNGNGGVGGNAVQTAAGGPAGAGGGVVLYGGGTSQVVNSTITDNQTGAGGAGPSATGGDGGGGVGAGADGNGGNATAGPGGSVKGGGLSEDFNTVTVRHVTVGNNTAGSPGPAGTATAGLGGSGAVNGQATTYGPGTQEGGGIARKGGALTLQNTIVASNSAPNCSGAITDGGHDLSYPDATCPGTNGDPLLGPLADNGGPTQTRALAQGSAAVDQVPADSGCAATDERGVARPQGAACDIGAYELVPPPVTTTASTGDQTPTTGPTGSTGAPPTVDTTPPVLTGFAVTNKLFAVGPKPTPISARAKKGTVFRYTLSEPGRVRITIQQALPGKRKGRRCVKPTPALAKAKACTRYVTRGSLTRRSVAGANRVAFSGRIGSRALKPGTYRATAVATDAAGNRSKPVRVKFTIVRR
ncbi:MAG: choice-of-anchor Q domain-containing protein [Thermoleophilaceae bacterium]